MLWLEDYLTYKLYEVTEQDVTATGGAGDSRYIKNTVLVFLPDTDRPEIGGEAWIAKSLQDARKVVETEKDRRPVKDVIDDALQRSAEIEATAQVKKAAMEREQDDEQRRREQEEILIRQAASE